MEAKECRDGFLEMDEWERREGVQWPLGVTWIESARSYNFALFSRHATAVTLLLYREEGSGAPLLEYPFDPVRNKTGFIWHRLLPEEALRGATLYAYRVDGPREPWRGHRFDPQKVLLDPFAREIRFPAAYHREALCGAGPTEGLAPLGVIPARREPFDWGDCRRPRHVHDLIVYELHVKGFTARESSGVSREMRGSFAGLMEKIPYLVDLGVTAELLPVHQYDPTEGNYWGYMTLNFFAPHRDYASSDDPADEFRRMVRAFHAAGIEVWLDVVYNHTSEGDASGPTLSYRGIDNRSYYLLAPGYRDYINDTGCGNTLRCSHRAVRGLILSSIHYWAQEMRVDGFRFDLASIFTRTLDGSVNTRDPVLVHEIGQLGLLDRVRLIAEAWDISAYLLGKSYPGLLWRQWNGKFRDDVRSFVRGDPGRVGALMQRLYGSDDLFPEGPREVYRPYQSVNFITAHDGFCLYDLVSYNWKHNEANGHGNSDGPADNISWNCGWEGDDGAPPEVAALRRRQVKNFFALLMLANGTPMFCAGDEFMNTQRGNNNPYNQDNETTWLDWQLLERNRDIHRFFKLMIAFRKRHPSIGRSRFWRGDVRWYGAAAAGVDLSSKSRSLAYSLRGARLGDEDIYVMINAHWEDFDFRVQEGRAGEWRRVVDTALESPEEIVEAGSGRVLASLDYSVRARSLVVLERRGGGADTGIA